MFNTSEIVSKIINRSIMDGKNQLPKTGLQALEFFKRFQE
jgi:hypothetical protein